MEIILCPHSLSSLQSQNFIFKALLSPSLQLQPRSSSLPLTKPICSTQNQKHFQSVKQFLSPTTCWVSHVPHGLAAAKFFGRCPYDVIEKRISYLLYHHLRPPSITITFQLLAFYKICSCGFFGQRMI